jgi:hypothetical protein
LVSCFGHRTSEKPTNYRQSYIRHLEWADYLLAPAFLLAAQRAFISCESFLLPAGVSPRFFFPGAAFLPALILAQRALAAAASLARVVGDIRRRPLPAAEIAGPPLRIEERRFSSESICLRIETASSKALTDISMGGQIAGVRWNGNQLLQERARD